MSKEIKGDRQRDERIDISSSPFGSLREEENDFKADEREGAAAARPRVCVRGVKKRTFVRGNFYLYLLRGIRVLFDNTNSSRQAFRAGLFRAEGDGGGQHQMRSFAALVGGVHQSECRVSQ